MKKLALQFTLFFLLFGLISLFIRYDPFSWSFTPGYDIVLMIAPAITSLVSWLWKQKPAPILLINGAVYLVFLLLTSPNRFFPPILAEVGLLGVLASSTLLILERIKITIEDHEQRTLAEMKSGVFKLKLLLPLIEGEFARGLRYQYPIALLRVNFHQNDLAYRTTSSPKALLRSIDLRLENFLKHNLRTTDMLSRLEGDNDYFLVCPGIDEEGAGLMKQRLTDRWFQQFDDKLAIQIAAFPLDGQSFYVLSEKLGINLGDYY